jgi:S-adenosylmethionine decarboxylase
MRQNALLRSGKGLGAASPARKRVPQVSIVAPVPAVERQDHFAERNGIRCAGVHLIVDVHGGHGLDDIDLLEATLRRCVSAAQATLLHIHVHHFHPNGVSGVAVLAESHISIHTWPDLGYAALDIFMCGQADPDACIPVL